MTRGTNRRDFLKASALAGVGYWVAGGVSAAESNSPNEIINFAAIGVRGKGESDTRDAANAGNLVAICDIDDNHLESAAVRYPQARKFNDFRVMLDEMGKSIDAVTVSTPDHTHAPASLLFMRAGKHCFTQKPMTHTIEEARVMGEVAREMKLATQMGNQYTAHPNLRQIEAVFKAGSPLGAIQAVHIWTNRPIWPQGRDVEITEEPVPANVHWDLFIGPAKMRPYSKAYHPFKWRGFWDFGTGALGDMACHTVNTPFAALDLRDPVSVVAETSGHDKNCYPGWSIIDFEFPARGNRGALAVTWYDGRKLPPTELFKGERQRPSGALIIGEKGTLYLMGDYAEQGIVWIGVDKPEVEFERSIGHFEEWVRAIKGGEPAKSNFPDYAGPLTETILLGNLAVWADGKKIEWDAEKLEATNAPEVMHVVKKEYHNGYSI
jgi:predicted dehydrogenase